MYINILLNIFLSIFDNINLIKSTFLKLFFKIAGNFSDFFKIRT
jgi:hypothetical protein